MIKIEHLKKTYITKNKEKSRGLVDVSFSLPSSGFIFVLGKSGSGKSTLLNILGLLDKKSDGKIFIEGKDSDLFSEKEIYFYRSTYCGFIFQDYQLINELTVKENIALSLELKSENNHKEERISKILEKVDLNGFENRYPNELSGGQKQRVSIARALIKNPKIILCDEPTGNLDKKTSINILNLLKEISSSCLVFMVSHDEKAAYTYADRIISLQEGLIIKDEIRDKSYNNDFKIINDEVYLPFNKNLTSSEKDAFNKLIKSRKLKKIHQLSNGFIKNEEIINDKNDFEFINHKFDRKSKNKLRNLYFKQERISSSIYSILFSLITVLLLLIQTFISFNSTDIILDTLAPDQKSLMITRINETANKNNGSFYRLTEDSEKEIFKNYNGEKFKVYNYTLYFSYDGGGELIESGYLRFRTNCFNQNGIYLGSTNGTAVVTEKYLNDRFKNENGELEILAGSLDNCKDSLSVIITDFLADCIFDSRGEKKDYSSLIGPLYNFDVKENKLSPYINADIGCIIKTNYREKYKVLFNQYDLIKDKDSKDEIQDLINSPEFNEYKSAVFDGDLSLDYTLNPNFYEQYCADCSSVRQFSRIGGLIASADNLLDNYDYELPMRTIVLGTAEVNNEITISSQDYQALAMMYETMDLVGKDLTFFKTDGNTLQGDYIDNITLKIKATTNGNYYATQETISAINAMTTFNYSYLVPNTSEGAKVAKLALNLGYSIQTADQSSYQLVTKTLILFKDIFIILEIIVFIFAILFFAVYSLKSIISKNYQIGIFKSLGMKNNDIANIFLKNNLTFAWFSIILAGLLSYPFFKLANYLLLLSYRSFTKTPLKKITVFYFHPDLIILDLIIILGIFILFTLIPLLITKFLSPAKIVNNKSE